MASFSTVFFAMVVVLFSASKAAPGAKNLSLKIPDECIGKGFCSVKPDGYDKILDIIGNLLTEHFITQNIEDRVGTEGSELSPEEDWHNCPYIKKTESKYAFHLNGSTPEFIIQHPQLLTQYVETVTCANEQIQEMKTESQECFHHLELGKFNMQSRCRSTMATRTLLVLDEKTQQIKEKKFEVPCCCTCQITRT